MSIVDDFGRIRLYNFPTWRSDVKNTCIKGHSSMVTNCKYSTDGNMLATSGGLDYSVCLWETHFQKGMSTAENFTGRVLRNLNLLVTGESPSFLFHLPEYIMYSAIGLSA